MRKEFYVTVNVTIRMDRQVRDQASRLFDELGLTTTQAVNMFLKQAIRDQAIPFQVSARPAAERVEYRTLSLNEE